VKSTLDTITPVVDHRLHIARIRLPENVCIMKMFQWQTFFPIV
jgi:hypothetical protein